MLHSSSTQDIYYAKSKHSGEVAKEETGVEGNLLPGILTFNTIVLAVKAVTC